jgi:hypothetical protein
MHCQNCGGALTVGASFCPSCGRRIGATAPTPAGVGRRSLLIGGAAAVAGVTGATGWKLLGGRDEPTAPPVTTSPDDKPARKQGDPANSPTLATYVPDLGQMYASGAYSAIAQSSIAHQHAERKASSAATTIEALFVERDLFDDDYASRSAPATVLGPSSIVKGAWVLFSYSWYLGLTDLPEGDFFSGDEWRPRGLKIGSGPQVEYRWVKEHEVTSSWSGQEVLWVQIGDNDASILYVPEHYLSPETKALALGIEQSEKTVKMTIAAETKVLGLDFLLVSKDAIDRKNQKIQELRDIQNAMALGVLLVGAFAIPLFAGLPPFALVGGTKGAALAASTLPKIVKAVDTTRKVMRFIGPEGVEQVLNLVGVELPEPGTPEREAADRLIAGLTSDRDLRSVAFDQLGGAINLFLPHEGGNETVLNAELLSQGLAKFDVSHPEAATAFPDYVRLALEAIDQGRNAAALWKNDRAYVNELRMLMG